MITYISYIPISLPHIHYGGGTDIFLSVLLAVYIAILVYTIIEFYKNK